MVKNRTKRSDQAITLRRRLARMRRIDGLHRVAEMSRIRSMTVGSSMLAITCRFPPHCRQASMSMANTRLREAARLFALRTGQPLPGFAAGSKLDEALACLFGIQGQAPGNLNDLPLRFRPNVPNGIITSACSTRSCRRF